jgi:cytosine/adenosine deaminase-related metal-dependent hydrolase
MDDIHLLASSGATVVHQPVIRARFGELLYSFARYQRAGVNMTIGTDEFPMDMLSEMRFAALMGKVADHDHLAVTARDVFNAATLNGAKALGRDDLGRLAAGARADIVIVDLRRLDVGLTPGDPIKTLVYMADYHDVETVIIDGRIVVENGRVPGIDEEKVAANTKHVLQKQTAAILRHTPTGMTAEEIFPPTFSGA